MNTNYIHIVEMTDEEKFEMYMKFTKEEIIKMHIELERVMKCITPQYDINRRLGPNPDYPVRPISGQHPIEYYLGTDTSQKLY